MNTKSNRSFSGTPVPNSNGMSLLDVLLAIVIFVIGMLALASLQGNLTRSSIDANSRTVGANYAEQLIEEYRTYERLESAAEGDDSYENIVTETLTETRGGIEYTVVVTVEDYYFLPDGVTVTNDPENEGLPQETTISNFKNVELDVSWTGNEFQLGNEAVTEGRLGSGNFVVSAIIPSIPTLGVAQVAAEDDGGTGLPVIPYSPGEAPDIIRFGVGEDKFRESTTPEPIVRRRDELVETWFDVITYNTVPSNTFLRREEFVSISCKCEIYSGNASDNGRRPTMWTGAEYLEGDITQKTYGVSASSGGQQSQYCDVCCQDHHDDSGSTFKYRPWMAGDEYSAYFAGDHPHYDRNNQGVLVEAVDDGDTYLEACRLVRKDGFFRVAQDFNLNEINVFPENYLGINATADYEGYVKAVVNEELGSYDGATAAPANRPARLELTFDGNEDAEGFRSEVPQANSAAPDTQLRSRGIYVDTLNSLLEANLEACFGNGNAVDCEVPDASSAFELYPFFDLQLTSLARWTEDKANDPIHITNDAIDPRGYSRGKASLSGTENGTSRGNSKIEKSNVGLISISSIIPESPADYSDADLFLVAGDGTEPPTGNYPEVSGTFTAEGGTADPSSAILTGSFGVECTAPTNGSLLCIFGENYTGGTATLTISGYSKKNTELYVCSNNLDVLVPTGDFNVDPVNGDNWTTFEFVAIPSTGASITITRDPCPEP